MESVLWRQKDWLCTQVTCPSVIAIYITHMKGVDLGDQLRKYQSVHLKCTKHYKYVFCDVCITNAYILNSLVPAANISLEQGRLKNLCVRLAQALIGDYISCQRGRCTDVSTTTRPPAVPNFHTPHHHPWRRCIYCWEYWNPPCRIESVWQCLQCDGGPALCLTGREDGSDCLSLWHKEE